MSSRHAARPPIALALFVAALVVVDPLGASLAAPGAATASGPPDAVAVRQPVDRPSAGPPAHVGRTDGTPPPRPGSGAEPPGGAAPPGRVPPSTGGTGAVGPEGCPDSINAEPAPVIRHGSRRRPVVALTFDDGWKPENVERILRILVRHRVNATFFPTGQAIERETASWRLVAAAGFPIANHTYRHPTLPDLCIGAQVRQLVRADQVMRSVLGIEPLPVMRPPYGAYDRSTRVAAAYAGAEAVVVWDVDARDWSGITHQRVARLASAGRKGSIIVLHTSPDQTVRALPAIIAAYRERGFEFVTLGQLLGIEGSVPFP